MMVNSLSTKTWRDKYRSAQIEQALKAALVAEKVCIVDNSPLYTISSPYLTAISTTVQALAGTYTPVAITTSTDTLTVADEVVAATHIFDFESTMANFDLFYTATRGITNSMVTAIDKWVDIIAHVKSSLIDSEAQKWATRAKEIFFSTLNDLTRGLHVEMQKSELCL